MHTYDCNGQQTREYRKSSQTTSFTILNILFTV